MYTVEKHRGLWWVIDAEGFEARSVGYETKKEALESARIVEQDDKADRARKQAFVDLDNQWSKQMTRKFEHYPGYNRMTREFEHYPGCEHHDPDNCSGCALTDLRQDAPNYSGWPLVYMENNRAIPAKWRLAFNHEMTQTCNVPYANNVRRTMERLGVRFTDGRDHRGALRK